MPSSTTSFQPYIIFACLLTLCIGSGHLVRQHSLKSQTYDGLVIDLAGRQRMLSQRLLAYAAIVQDNVQKDENVEELSAVAEEWSAAHVDLLQGNLLKNIPAVSDKHQAALQALTPLINASLVDVEALTNIERISFQKLHDRLNIYLPRMNTIVKDLANESRNRIVKAQRNGMIISVILLISLLTLIYFFLLPAHRKNVALIDQLQTHEEQMEKQLQDLSEANEGLNQFMYVASHDMKTPLRSIGSFAALIQRRYGDNLPEGATEYFDYIKNNAKSMSRVLDDLVKFNQAGAKRKLEVIDLDKVAKQVKSNLAADLESVGAILKIDFLGKVMGSEVVVSQILQNLILNALVYRDLERQCRVTIVRKSSRRGTVLIVTDNGVGLDTKYREKVFLPFQRVGELDRPGTGMGLSICRKLARSIGGDITYQGEVGVGTSFYVGIDCVPLLKEETEAQAIPI